MNSNLEAPYLKHLIQPFINLSVFYTGKKVHIFLVDFSLKTLWRTNLEVNSASTTFLAVWSGERQEYHCLTSFCYKAVTKRSNTEGCCKDWWHKMRQRCWKLGLGDFNFQRYQKRLSPTSLSVFTEHMFLKTSYSQMKWYARTYPLSLWEPGEVFLLWILSFNRILQESLAP